MKDKALEAQEVAALEAEKAAALEAEIERLASENESLKKQTGELEKVAEIAVFKTFKLDGRKVRLSHKKFTFDAIVYTEDELLKDKDFLAEKIKIYPQIITDVAD